MKKIFAILMAICMMVSAISVASITASAADTVLRVSIVKNNGSTILGEYADFEEGWNYAVEIADAENMVAEGYSRIIVDICADWTADGGSFGSGDGFSSGAIKFPENVRVTLNLNGHTIDRDLSDWKWNGEVIYVDENANVIINDGTITGGWSGGGAGGIHIDDGARVELNNVNIKDNTADDDDGGGIAVYDGAILTMNGGSFMDNELNGQEAEGTSYYGGAVYVEDSTATFNGVMFKDNYTEYNKCFGAAIYAADSNVTISECTFIGNGRKGATQVTMSTIHADDSTITVKGSAFIENGDKRDSSVNGGYSAVFMLDNSTLTMEKGENSTRFRGNTAHFLINDVDDSTIFISDAYFTDNASAVLYGDDYTSAQSYFKNCTFKNNKNGDFVSFYGVNTPLAFIDCDMGDSTFGDESYIQFEGNTVQPPSKEPAEGTVMRVSAQRRSGEIIVIKDYTEFDEGWEAAIDLAKSEAGMAEYSRVIVDFYGDWTADEDGVFGDSWRLSSNWGDGFAWNTIYVPENVRITLNLNGHTINRGLEDSEDDGEVIYIDGNADVIINNGTIKGGNSLNGAGGIHVNGAYLTLNDVHIVGNVADKDDGGGIALYSGSTLIMNGGSFKDNVIVGSWSGTHQCYGGAIYVDDSKASFYNVEFRNNQTEYDEDYGAAIYVNDGEVYMNNCIVDGNGIQDDAKDFQKACSIIHAEDSKLQIEKTTFTNNGGGYHYDPRYAYDYSMTEYIGFYSSVFTLEDSDLFISADSKISNNNVYYIVFARQDAGVYVTDTTITDNTAMVMWSSAPNKNDNYFKNCTIHNNKLTSTKIQVSGTPVYKDYHGESFDIGMYENFPAVRVVFENCEMGDSKFEEWVLDYILFSNCKNAPKQKATGSIFGEGSPAMIIAILALAVAAVSIFLIVDMRKKLIPAAADNAEKTKTENN